MDETGFLQESEIYCHVQKEDGGKFAIIIRLLPMNMRREWSNAPILEPFLAFLPINSQYEWRKQSFLRVLSRFSAHLAVLRMKSPGIANGVIRFFLHPILLKNLPSVMKKG